jgi:hypothetical protein
MSMAINVDNWGYINGGSTIEVGLLINDGQDFGAQFFEGKPQDANNTLTTNNEGISFGVDGKHAYWFQLHCDGVGTRYALCGGGFTAD